MPTPAQWKCHTCGEWHETPPLCFGADQPTLWWSLSKEEQEQSELVHSLCVIRARDETAYIVRGHLYIPIHGNDEPFVWSVWVTLSEKSFARTQELWDQEGRETEPPYFGWLVTKIPVYDEDTMFLKASVQTQPVGQVPLITLEPTEHPLAVDQRNGVDMDQALAWVAKLLHA